MSARIYLDHAATTPMRAEAIDAVADGMRRWANPSSPHAEGRAARAALEGARARIKAALGWDGELIFTSGASEALAIGLRGHPDAVASAVEHDAVGRLLPDRPRLPVNASGLIDVGRSDYSTSDRLAVQHANSETGVIQQIGAIGKRHPGSWLCDASQTAGKLPLPDADLVVVSAHKLGGPPGIGALLVRDLGLLTPGGGQERGYRGGTENLPAALGFAAALEAPRDWFDAAPELRNTLEIAIHESGGEIVCHDAPRIPTIGAYRLPGMSAAAQLIRLDAAGFAVSAGSACSSGSLKPSHVLEAIGMDRASAGEVIRVSFGHSTTREEVDAFAAAWTAMAADARARAA